MSMNKYLIPALLLAQCLLAACHKQKLNAVATSPEDTANTMITQVLKPLYPYCDTFYGAYNENIDQMYYMSGHSRVFVWHIDKDTIDIKSDSIGIGRPAQYRSHDDTIAQTTRIDIPGRTNADTFAASFYVQWLKDRYDAYKLRLSRDSLTVQIRQETGGCGNGDYTGTYTGYPTHRRR